MVSLIGKLMRQQDWERRWRAQRERSRWNWLRRYTKRKRKERKP